MPDRSQFELWEADAPASFDEQAANDAYRESREYFDEQERAANDARRNSRKKRPAPPPRPDPGPDPDEIPIEIDAASLKAMLDRARQQGRQQGRREGLGEAVQAARIAIDARFRLEPKEFVIGELPTGLDIGELLEAHNRFLAEYGKRAYADGIDSARAEREDENGI